MYLVGNIVASRLLDKHPRLMVPKRAGRSRAAAGAFHWSGTTGFTRTRSDSPAPTIFGPSSCLAWMSTAVQNWVVRIAVGLGSCRSSRARYKMFTTYLGDVT
jgi:hypothetical protein